MHKGSGKSYTEMNRSFRKHLKVCKNTKKAFLGILWAQNPIYVK